jgi:membrane protein
MITWFRHHYRSLVGLFSTDIWTSESLTCKGPRGRLHAFLRVLSITKGGLEENRAASRAAALSFSSLIGLGPIVVLAVMVAGFLLDSEDPDLATDTLNKVLVFVAPQLAQLEKVNVEEGSASSAAAQQAITTSIEVDPQLVSFIDTFVSSARNGTVGAIGAITLIIIVLQLFTSIETAFNEIWGVRQGRSWLMRVVYYWTAMSLGAFMFFASVTGLSASAIMATFAEVLPFGDQLVDVLQFFLPLGSFIMIWTILMVFYRAIPNTHVNWVPAAVGALLVGLLLLANNYMAFLYISWVLRQKVLYGSLAIPVVLMFGLYVFWLLVLLGGQVSYAIQNVRFRNSRAAWNNLAEALRERLSLTVLLSVCRRFHACSKPPTASELGDQLGVPDQILNECLHRLVQMRLLTPIPAPDGKPAVDQSYLPARPLGRTTLAHFKHGDDHFGKDSGASFAAFDEPLLDLYHEANDEFARTGLFCRSLDELFAEFPLPPAANEAEAKATP